MSTLFVVSTPIGNLEDITLRAVKTLWSVDTIACEDTRVTGQLLDLLRKRYPQLILTDRKPKLLSYRNTNEQNIVPVILDLLQKDADVALVTDAGTPLISDPGYRIVSECRKRDIPIIIIPGVSAFLTALTGSGMPANTFTFLGYLPEKPGVRQKLLEKMKQSSLLLSSTYICYIAPHKLIQTLDAMMRLYGDIEIVIARELTKLHEEYWYGTIIQAQEHFKEPKGEFVLLFTFNS